MTAAVAIATGATVAVIGKPAAGQWTVDFIAGHMAHLSRPCVVDGAEPTRTYAVLPLHDLEPAPAPAEGAAP